MRAGRARRVDDEVSSSSPPGSAEDDDPRTDFFADFDPQAFLAQLDEFETSLAVPATHAAHAAPPPPPVETQAPASRGGDASADFYGTAIQILTHILGSSTPQPWLSDATPRPDDAAADRGALTPPYVHDLTQPMLNALVQRLGGSSAPREKVREQDLTQLLHTLLQQREPTGTTAATTSAPEPAPRPAAPPPRAEAGVAHFADLTFPDDEEDDPDFMPVATDADELAGGPSASAWTRAMAEIGALPSSPPAPDEPKTRRGRPRQFTAEEAVERKRGRNREYMARQRGKRQRAKEDRAPPPAPDTTGGAAPSDMTASMSTLPATAPAHGVPPGVSHDVPHYMPGSLAGLPALPGALGVPSGVPALPSAQSLPSAPPVAPAAPADDRLVLEAENRFLRAELERLREENAQLRGREEMRLYAARLGMDKALAPPPLPSSSSSHVS